MSDFIDRETAIKAVNTALFPSINAAKEVEKIIRKLPSALGWIPVTERQPTSPGLYIVTCIAYDMSMKPAGISTSCSHWHDNEWQMDGVTAWMPLPEPYTEG